VIYDLIGEGSIAPCNTLYNAWSVQDSDGGCYDMVGVRLYDQLKCIYPTSINWWMLVC